MQIDWCEKLLARLLPVSLRPAAEEEFEYDDQDVELRSAGEDDDDQMVIEPPEVRRAPYLIMNPGLADERIVCIHRSAPHLIDIQLRDWQLIVDLHFFVTNEI